MNNDILFEIKSLMRSINRNFFEKNETISKAPTPTQFKIMEYMCNHQNEKIYQKDLEKFLNVRRATVSEVLKTMEKNDLLKKTANKNDLRSKEIVITEKAKKIFEIKRKKIQELQKIITKKISKEDLNTFIKTINQMKQNVKEENNDKINEIF